MFVFCTLYVLYVLAAARHFYHLSDITAFALQDRAISKVTPIALLLLLSLTLGGAGRPSYSLKLGGAGWPSYSLFVAAGLLLCGVGDVCLEACAEDGDDALFLAGLGAFLCGHLLFIAAFATNLMKLKAIITVPIFAYAMSVFAYLQPHVKAALVGPVFVYAITIGAMAAASLCRQPPPGPYAYWSKMCGAAGALVFVVSDTILSVNMFVFKISNACYYIMATYYAGVCLIALSTSGGGSGKTSAKKGAKAGTKQGAKPPRTFSDARKSPARQRSTPKRLADDKAWATEPASKYKSPTRQRPK